MRDVTTSSDAAVDIWLYVDRFDPAALGVIEIGDVVQVYRDADHRYDHVLLRSETADVYVVIVVNVSAGAVFGHHLLNPNDEYGVAGAQ